MLVIASFRRSFGFSLAFVVVIGVMLRVISCTGILSSVTGWMQPMEQWFAFVRCHDYVDSIA